MAGLGPQDLDLIELHDAFAATEIPKVEDMGICFSWGRWSACS